MKAEPLSSLHPHANLYTFEPIETVNPLLADRPALPAQYDMDPLEAESMRRELQAAGLTTSLNLRYMPLAIAAAE